MGLPNQIIQINPKINFQMFSFQGLQISSVFKIDFGPAWGILIYFFISVKTKKKLPKVKRSFWAIGGRKIRYRDEISPFSTLNGIFTRYFKFNDLGIFF